MDFITQQDRTYDGLRDAAKEFIVPVEVRAWINEAQRDLAHRLKILQKELAANVGVSQEVPLPADLIEIRELRIGTDNADVNFTDSERWWDASDALLADPYGGPFGRVWEGNIEVYPKPVDGTAYKLRYIYEPADLVADGDISVLPLELHPKMVDYARSQAFLRLNETVAAQSHLNKYLEGLPSPPLGQNRIMPKPRQLRHEAGPFDLDPGHAHRG